jgi:hypothetical protein
MVAMITIAAFISMKISDPLRGAATCSRSCIGSHAPQLDLNVVLNIPRGTRSRDSVPVYLSR